MEQLSRGGRSVPGFALGQADDAPTPSLVVQYAVLMTGVATGLLVGPVLKAPLWGAILAGAGAAVVAKAGIERAAREYQL